MYLKALTVKNFRALEDISIEFDGKINAIVGPNAIGKTTILEAIRLPRAILAARTPSEATQILLSLGAISPQNQQMLMPETISRNAALPTQIGCRYRLTASEIATLQDNAGRIGLALAQSRIGQSFVHPASLAPFLSSSQGQMAIQAAQKEIGVAITTLRTANGELAFTLTIDPRVNQIDCDNGVFPELLAFLERNNPPNRTTFSYFPADRAMPTSEQPIQLGSADAGQQIESHNSQPQLKYSRLKNTVFNAMTTMGDQRNEWRTDFEKIFTGLLKSRELAEVGISQYGSAKIKVRDIESGNTFDIDQMSSGEKGLILTFLIVGGSMLKGGIVLIDEPELHLNAAVCKGIIPFLLENYVSKNDLQVILCSHSAEILASTFDSDECSLFHVVSEKLITKIRKQDQDVVAEALKQLGTSESEGLLYKATIFVEGPDDVELLETGFGDFLRRYKIKDLGGRGEIEKHIRSLQEADKANSSLAARYFIFDRDRMPSSLASTKLIKVLQWQRYCIENYLIDLDIITDLLKDDDYALNPAANVGEVTEIVKRLALSQIRDVAIKNVYSKNAFDGLGLRSEDLKQNTVDGVADTLLARIESLRHQVAGLDPVTWKPQFLVDVAAEERVLRPVWDVRWPEICDGKRLFSDLQREVALKVSSKRLKKEILRRMKTSVRSEPYTLALQSLKNLIGSDVAQPA